MNPFGLVYPWVVRYVADWKSSRYDQIKSNQIKSFWVGMSSPICVHDMIDAMDRRTVASRQCWVLPNGNVMWRLAVCLSVLPIWFTVCFRWWLAVEFSVRQTTCNARVIISFKANLGIISLLDSFSCLSREDHETLTGSQTLSRLSLGTMQWQG